MSNSILFVNSNQEFGKEFHMDDLSKKIGQNVKRIREAIRPEMSQAELARRIGVKSQNTIASIETGKTEKSKHLPAIARVLKVSLADIDPSQEGEETLTTKDSMSSTEQSDQLDVYASVEGGSGAIVWSNEPMLKIPRPRPLIGVRDAYGVLVVGESMTPLIRPGFTVWVNPHLPPRPDDLCIFRHDEEGDFRATLKEYCGQTQDSWLVRRYQPQERRFTLKKAEWPICHVIVGTDYGR
jgi:transcriptional regulator with XRE-family HTH domain